METPKFREGVNLLSGLTGIGDLIVRGWRGDDVLLPCSYSKAGELSASASVLWIDPNDKVVVKLRQNLTGNAFASSFPKEQEKGNFSIVVKNAQPSHSGMYLCSIPTISHTKKIYLNVSGLCWRIISAPKQERWSSTGSCYRHVCCRKKS